MKKELHRLITRLMNKHHPKLQVIIWIGILYLIFISKNSQNIILAEFLITLSYIVLISKIIRPNLVQRWGYFSVKPSAPYTLTFIGLLFFGILFMIVNLEPVAEQFANIAYIMLVIAIVLEIKEYVKRTSNE